MVPVVEKTARRANESRKRETKEKVQLGRLRMGRSLAMPSREAIASSALLAAFLMTRERRPRSNKSLARLRALLPLEIAMARRSSTGPSLSRAWTRFSSRETASRQCISEE